MQKYYRIDARIEKERKWRENMERRKSFATTLNHATTEQINLLISDSEISAHPEGFLCTYFLAQLSPSAR